MILSIQTMNCNRFLSAALTAIGAVLILALSIAPVAGAQNNASTRRPNILVIVADDLGYGDLGIHGCKDIPTPHIDSIAQNGVRCTSGYVSCPVCSPTRAGLLTGRYQQRFGHEFNPGPPALASREFGLPLSEITLADRLKEAGYVTGMVGKWHLGLNEKFHPLRHGFSEYFGFLHGAHSYIDPQADSRNPVLRGTNRVDKEEYLTDAFTREAVAFVDRHQQEPFFLYLAYNAVHAPLQATQKYLERLANIPDQKRRTYAAMLSAMDDGIGTVLKKLRDTKAEDNTLIFFISDNGGPITRNASRNEPFSGAKTQVWEGGIHVPFFVQWKKRLPAGRVYEQPVIALDIFTTALTAAGARLPGDRVIDGVDLLPYLAGENTGPPHECLFWRFGASSAVRKGPWKLLHAASDSPRLFDLSKDLAEKNDLIEQEPVVAKELQDAWKRWDAQLAKPLWGRPR